MKKNEFDIQTNGDNIPNENDVVLRCGFKFSKEINEKCIPSSVTDLQLHNYNIELNSYSIPSSVVSLSLGSNFTNIKALSNLPNSIIDLIKGKKFGIASGAVEVHESINFIHKRFNKNLENTIENSNINAPGERILRRYQDQSNKRAKGTNTELF
ncbi:hypothetical protein ACTFIY_009240 [Dictyostelium cf. discoideum]